MTGLHAPHMIIGIPILLVIALAACRGRLRPPAARPRVEFDRPTGGTAPAAGRHLSRARQRDPPSAPWHAR